ncbi:MAG: LPS translocon maturation chaperone LptM [Sodalis sp. (in: enterobacteria)]|uniref:LPS translocon maturation chaperone LptM n=1 Tax=Sodalis sp. (in: enterobacteria) TaxID=1898979 RepID=UPI0039E6148B
MKSELRRAALGLMLLGLYGCGLKGPLYFPPADKADKSEQKHQLTTTPSSTQSPVQTASPGDDSSSAAVGTEQP